MTPKSIQQPSALPHLQVHAMKEVIGIKTDEVTNLYAKCDQLGALIEQQNMESQCKDTDAARKVCGMRSGTQLSPLLGQFIPLHLLGARVFIAAPPPCVLGVS